VPTEQNASSRRVALAKARQSRRPSRLGTLAGTQPEPDYTFGADAGFPRLLAHVWREAMAAGQLRLALNTLLTLGGHVPADVQLRALRFEEECALRALFGVSWRRDDVLVRPVGDAAARPVFLGEIGLSTTGRVVVSVPSRASLASEEHLVGAAMRVPWSGRALSAYRDGLRVATARRARSIADCRAWLAAVGDTSQRDRLVEELKQAALRTAPLVLYQDGGQYTNFRERNNLTGKTLWPGHPDCALSGLQGLPLDRWSDSDAVLVACLSLLVRSSGYARIEEANGTQLTVDHVAELLERTRRRYNQVPDGAEIAPASGTRMTALNTLAEALGRRRRELARRVQLYREIHGPLMHKIERIAGPPADPAQRRENALCTRLRQRIPVTGDTLAGLAASLAASPGWLARPYGGFGTGLEAVVYETVSAARSVFGADFAMSRGIRSLPQLVRALRREDWAEIVGWDLPEYFCCVVAAPEARRFFGDSAARLADVAWSISARMQYNCWHFIAGNLPKVPEVEARDYFVPPVIPDVAYHSDQHHHGHVAARVRFSIRSPQPVDVLGRTFAGFVDLRLLRCEGPPFDEQDLLAAHRASAFIAKATGLAADLVAGGEDLVVTAFDPAWHWDTIAAYAEGEE
jgi:hypothetical protein